MMTVKMGAELFTVSAKETATFFRLTKPRTTVMNLGGGGGWRTAEMTLQTGEDVGHLRSHGDARTS